MYIFALGTAVVALLLLTIFLLILRQKSSMIFGLYPKKGAFYHLKFYLALIVLDSLRRKLYKNNRRDKTKEFLEQLDCPQPLSDNPKSYDVVSFWGAASGGEKLMVTLERRRRGILKGCIYIWLPEQGLLCSPNLPDMVYFTTDGKQENSEFKGSGFHIYPEECMRSWRFKYEGQLKVVKTNELIDTKLNMQFCSKSNYFDYNRDLSANIIADAVAREAWNDDFYNMLKNVDQILSKRLHYEQSGLLKGEVILNNKSMQLQLPAFRDHSFGTERCLSTINRYVYLSLFLEDGTTFVIGNLSQPSFFLSSLKVGYVCSSDSKYYPITACNFELYSYGEKGVPPTSTNFIVSTEKNKYFVQIKAEDEAIRYMGGNWESKCYNQFVSCTVNGIKGQGITEFLYRNKTGRPEEICSKDPEWYRKSRNFERNLSTGQNIDESEDFFF